MTELRAMVESLLVSGLNDRLFSAAAAGVRTSRERIVVAVGTASFETPEPISTSTLFDLASLTKTYTAVAAMALVDRGVLELDEPVVDRIPIGRDAGAERITLRMLLRHTSGLPAVSDVWRDSRIAVRDRMGMVLGSELVSEPDRSFIYSCPGYVAVGALIEAVTAVPPAESLAAEVFAPLGLSRTGFGPVDPADSVATEYQPDVGRCLVHGEVHDELSWYLGGRTGNAGLFAPVEDVLRFADRTGVWTREPFKLHEAIYSSDD